MLTPQELELMDSKAPREVYDTFFKTVFKNARPEERKGLKIIISKFGEAYDNHYTQREAQQAQQDMARYKAHISARNKALEEKEKALKARVKQAKAMAEKEALRAHNEKEAEKVTAFHNKMYTATEIDYGDDETASDTRRVAKPRGTIVKNERRSKAQKERWAKRRAATAAAAAAAALLDFTGATVIEIESGTSEIDEDETVE